ncbi:hypothetical protein Tco_1030335 [Tanacetum coccineum]|uniref:Homologous recombination OB-fold protein OB-fold domain-containing protein n=1 Tax=Tanacetum coccineum TaxID=301880 RepID=A0ABQ5G635_9ASTR
MVCSIPHSDDEIQALVQKQIDEDMVHQKAIMDLALQFDNACTTKKGLRKAYEKFNHIPQKSRVLIDTFLKEGSDKDYELNLSILDIDDSDLHLTPVLRSSSSAHVEPSPYTPNPVTIIPGPVGVVQLSNSICVEPSSSTPNPVRIIPGPAGLVQRAKLLKENIFILDPDGALMSTQEYMQKVVEDVDFNSGVWVRATNYVNAFGGTVTGCLGDIDNFLKKGKLKQVVAIVKSCSPNALGDLNVTLKDLSGTVPGTIHYKVLDVGSYEKDIIVGAAMILANVLVLE